MRRRVRRHPVYRAAVAEAVRWVTTRRSSSEVQRLQAALQRGSAQVASYPGLGREVDVLAGWSIRVIRLGRLPYLLWYAFDRSRARAPVWLVFLTHEKQDRSRFDPRSYDGIG